MPVLSISEGRLYAKAQAAQVSAAGVRSGTMTRLDGAPRRRGVAVLLAVGGRPGARPIPSRRRCAPRRADHTYNLEHDWRWPRSARRSPPTRRTRAPTAASRVAVAEHHVPPRQHDGGRLPRPPQQAEREPAARRRRRRRSPAFRDAIEKAIGAGARSAIAPNPQDADAHYQLGAAVGLRASYTATVEGSVARRVPRRARGVRRAREGARARSRSARTPG